MDDNASWLAFKDQLQAHYQALEAYHRELGGDYTDSSASLMDVLQAALQASLEATKAECDRVREDCESMLKDMTRMRMAMGEASKVTGSDDPFSSFGARSRIKAPLLDSQKVLRIEHTAIRKAFQDRAGKVVDLHDRLKSYLRIIPASTIGFSLPDIDEDHPPTDVSLGRLGQLDTGLAQCKQEISRRKKQVQAYGRDIVQLWAELAIQSSEIDSALDRAILLDAQEKPEALGLMDEDLHALHEKRAHLLDEKIRRKEIVDSHLSSIRSLYKRLKLSEADLTHFCTRVRGFGEPAMSLCREELDRLNELKKDHIEDFIKDARVILEELWDTLYYDENDRLEFTPAFAETYTDAALQAHENEIAKLQAKIKELEPLLTLIGKHMKLAQERKDLEVQVSDPARFSKRGYNPMAESKLRARIENAMPRIEKSLREAFAKHEETHAVPFRVWGGLYLDAAAPVRRPISRHENGSARGPQLKNSQDVTRNIESQQKMRPRTPATLSRPGTSQATPLRTVHPLARSFDSSRAPSTSPAKRSTSAQDRSAKNVTVLRERADPNSSRLPTMGKMSNSAKVSVSKNPRQENISLSSSQHTHATQMAPPKMAPPKMIGREVSGSSTSSQVSTENWDAFQRESSDEDEEEDATIARLIDGKRGGMYDRAKTTEVRQKHIFNPASSTHSRDGLIQSPLQHVIEEGSFVDDWEGEGF